MKADIDQILAMFAEVKQLCNMQQSRIFILEQALGQIVELDSVRQDECNMIATEALDTVINL